MGRTILGVLLGLLGGGAIVAIGERAGHVLSPPPPELESAIAEAAGDLTRLRELLASIEVPTGSLLAVAAAWLTGSFVGAWIASRVGRGWMPAVVVGVLLGLAALLDLMYFPHPSWFWVLGLGVYVPGTWLGTRLGVRRSGTRVTDLG